MSVLQVSGSATDDLSAKQIYQTANEYVCSVRIKRQRFSLVKTRWERWSTSVIRDINNDIYVPLTTIALFMGTAGEGGGISVSEIVIRIKDSVQIKAAEKVIRSILERLHDSAKDYEVIGPQELLRQTQKTQRMFNIVMGSIAGISLLVGGIGIMNIMLATVTERTREIGIRRALGAKRRNITTQFLVETVVLSTAGGVLGVLRGVSGAYGITRFADWETIVSGWSVAVSFGLSVLVGIFFGMYPAMSAARLDPIEAFRSDWRGAGGAGRRPP